MFGLSLQSQRPSHAHRGIAISQSFSIIYPLQSVAVGLVTQLFLSFSQYIWTQLLNLLASVTRCNNAGEQSITDQLQFKGVD